ncbi:MAG TPA: ribonuclease III [Opitutaceae bacterium]|jgi:ribonuclease-3
MSPTLQALEERIGYVFRNRALLEEALTHRSWLFDHPQGGPNNQRLEFLGDSVLQFVLTQALFELYPSDPEGDLSRRRALLSGGRFLVTLARELGLDRCLRLGANEEATGGRTRDAALEDALEALIGAIYLDGGHEAARQVLLGLYGDLTRRLAGHEDEANPKGRLQELVHATQSSSALRYTVVATEGADHARRFEVAVDLNERRLGTGQGLSKKEAEEDAARAALAQLKTGDPAR